MLQSSRIFSMPLLAPGLLLGNDMANPILAANGMNSASSSPAPAGMVWIPGGLLLCTGQDCTACVADICGKGEAGSDSNCIGFHYVETTTSRTVKPNPRT